jgi:diguanylate cyclase (GGDEF)-like protein/PAS domain S-box-containing protein
MYSEVIRQKAMARARDEGVAAMSAKVTLVQETERDIQAGVLLYVPVYQRNMPMDTTEQRRAAHRGWAYSPLRMRDMMSSFIEQEHPENVRRIDLQIYDGEPRPEALLFSTPATSTPLEVAATLIRIQVAGAVWTLVGRPLPGFNANAIKNEKSLTILIAGTLVTLLLALLSAVLARTHRRVAESLHQTAQANRTLAEQENLLRTIYDSSSVAIFLVSSTGRITHANQRMSEMFLCPLDQLIGSEYVAHIHPSERDIGRERMLQLIAQQIQAVNLERRYWREDGSEFWGLLTGRPIRNAAGTVVGLVGVIADITQRKQGEAAMQLTRTVFESSPEGILVTDADNHILSINPAFAQITGFTEAEVMGKDPRMLNSGRQSVEFYRGMWQAIQQRGRWEGELWNRHKDGHVYPEMLSISRVLANDGSVANYIGIFQDITARRQADDRIRYLAHHDYLTGLPNRAFFVDHVAQALALARRYERRLAILFMDLDRFKPINDQFGHDAGDEVLREIAKRLLDAVRESDMLCRQGGDEFLVLVPEAHGDTPLEELASKLLAAIQRPILWHDQSFVVSASIGIATYPECGSSVDSLIQSADSAMYLAKVDSQKPIVLARGTPG